MKRWLGRLAVVLLTLCVLLFARAAFAQDDDDFGWYEDEETSDEQGGYGGLWLSLILKALFSTKLGGLLTIGGLAGLSTVARYAFGPYGAGASGSSNTKRGRYTAAPEPTQKTCEKCQGLNLPTARSCYYCGESLVYGHAASATNVMAPAKPQQPQFYSAKLGAMVNADGTPVAASEPPPAVVPESGMTSSSLMSPGSAMSSAALMAPGSGSPPLTANAATAVVYSSAVTPASAPPATPATSRSAPKIVLASSVNTAERPRGAKVCRECGGGSPTCAVRCFTCATPI